MRRILAWPFRALCIVFTLMAYAAAWIGVTIEGDGATMLGWKP